jgi:hypothetical protein
MVGIGMHWLGCDIEIVVRNIFVMTVQVKTNTPNYRVSASSPGKRVL